MKPLIDKSLDLLLVVILSIMALLVAANVFCRFVLKFSIYWGDEVAMILMVWLTFLGAAVVVREKGHYVFDYLIARLDRGTKRKFILLRDVINLVAPLVLGYFSLQVSWQIHYWIMPATEISRSLVYGACPVGCFFMLYYGVLHLIADLKRPDASA